MAVFAALLGAMSLDVAAIQDDYPYLDCANAGSTIEQNICAGREVRVLEDTLAHYTNTAYALIREHSDANAELLISEIKESEQLWKAYADAACGAVYTQWSSGTIRNVMAASCHMELIRERTHHIWREYLVTMEGLAKLPEPERTEYDFGVED